MLNKFDNLYSMIMEGMFFSFDVKQLEQFILKQFPDKVTLTETDPEIVSSLDVHPKLTGLPATLHISVKPFSKSEKKQLLAILKKYGYYIAKRTKDKERRENIYQIEPLHGVQFQPEFWGIKELFHITPTTNVPDILKNGLLYRKHQTSFGHPGDRIFLCFTRSSDVLISWARQLAKDKYKNKDVESVEMSVLSVDVTSLINLYLDDTAILGDFRRSNQTLLAVYTTSAISPSRIRLSQTITVKLK
jgi:hypothetical protein